MDPPLTDLFIIRPLYQLWLEAKNPDPSHPFQKTQPLCSPQLNGITKAERKEIGRRGQVRRKDDTGTRRGNIDHIAPS